MSDLNLWVGTGRLGKDPEVKSFSNGGAVCNVSMASSKKWKDKTSGEQREITTWVPLVFNDKSDELIGKFGKKGSRLRITGEFQVRKWQDKDGAERYSTEIRVSDFQLLDGKPEGQTQQEAPAQRRAPAPESSHDKEPF